MEGLIYKDIRKPIGSIRAAGLDRKLAALHPHPDMLSAMRQFAAVHPITPLEQLQECDFEFYGSPKRDQGQHGSCTNHAGTTVFDVACRMSGWTPPLLSCTFAYAQVNNGQDNGASVTSILQVLEYNGMCLDSECGEDTIYKQDVPQSAYTTAALYKAPRDAAQGAFLVRSFAEICSAINSGFPVAFGISVGQNFSNLDAEGVCPAPDIVDGGHALAGIGLKKSSSGAWLIKFQNSWTAEWGINGCAYLGQASFDRMIDAYAIIMPKVSTADTDQPPAVVKESVVVPTLPFPVVSDKKAG